MTIKPQSLALSAFVAMITFEIASFSLKVSSWKRRVHLGQPVVLPIRRTYTSPADGTSWALTPQAP